LQRFPKRGGNWNNTSNCGLGAVNFNNERSNTNTNIVVRPASHNARCRMVKAVRTVQIEKGACPILYVQENI
jgi:hypothetical protein